MQLQRIATQSLDYKNSVKTSVFVVFAIELSKLDSLGLFESSPLLDLLLKSRFFVSKSFVIFSILTFFNVGSNLASRILKEKRPSNAYLRKAVINSFFINPIQESEIEKLINNLNKNKSLGTCSINVKILQNHVDVLKQPLKYLTNLSFQQGKFPEALKTARVTHIFKKEDPQLPSSYCPISVLFLANCMKNVCILAFTRF